MSAFEKLAGELGSVTEPAGRVNWERINLADPCYAVKPMPPAWNGLVYQGKRHLLSGPPEAAKTLLAWIFLTAALRDGVRVAAVDFEMGPEATRLMLLELGLTLMEIKQVVYFEPETEPDPADIRSLADDDVQLVLVDALAGAYNVSGLDDGKRKEVETWQNLWTRPLYKAGIASLVVDHVVKNDKNRGSFSIGSERKLGGVDVHLGVETIKPLARGGHGLYKAHVHKDRPGYLRAGGIREIELHSDPQTHALTWTIRETGVTTRDSDHWQPTVLMEKVSRFLEQHDGPASRNAVESGVQGKSRQHIRQAMDELVAAGNIAESKGTRGARMLSLVTPFHDLARPRPTSPGEVRADLAHLAPPLQGGEVRGEDESGEVNGSTSGEVNRLAWLDTVEVTDDEHRA